MKVCLDTDCVWLLFWNSTEKSPRKTSPKSAQFLEVSSKFEPGYPSRGSWFGRPPEAQTEENCSKWERLMAQICLFWRCWSTACQAVLLHQVQFFIRTLHLVSVKGYNKKKSKFTFNHSFEKDKMRSAMKMKKDCWCWASCTCLNLQ